MTSKPTKGKRPSQLTKSGIAMRLLISELSITQDGFAVEAAEHLDIKTSRIFKYCARIINEGKLFRAKVTGTPVHYHATKELSLAWLAATPKRYAEQKPRIHKTTPGKILQMQRSSLLNAAIYRGATSDAGFVVTDKPEEVARVSAYKRCVAMVNKGELFTAAVENKVRHYFTTKEAADAYLAEFVKRQQAKISARGEVFARKQAQVIARSAYVAPKPKVVAEIVHTANTRYVIAQTPPQRFTTIDRPAFAPRVYGGMGQMR